LGAVHRLIHARLIHSARVLLTRRAVRFALAVLVLGAILARVDRARLAETLQGFEPVYGLAMVAVFLATLLLFAARWWLIAGALGIRAPWREFVRVLWVSQCAGEFGPALVVGELARFQLMRGRGDPWTLAASQAVDRFSGKSVLLLMVLGLLPFYLTVYRESPLLQIAAFALILLGLGVGGIWLARRFRPMARSRLVAIVRVCHPRISPGHYGLSLLIQVLLSANVAVAALGLGFRGDWLNLLLLGPLLLLGVGSLPGLVSDWGKREAAAVVLLAPAGLTPEQSLAVSLIYGAGHLLAALPGALLWAGIRRGIPVAGQRPPPAGRA
jgi:uncharacterized membrane protein YbhN (UPF0104 family)